MKFFRVGGDLKGIAQDNETIQMLENLKYLGISIVESLNWKEQ